MKNSLDLLRLIAATLVLYSHQYALMGLSEPSFFGLTTFGGAGVSIFFFLSGVLVRTSWERDPHLMRFFIRRSLRIFPALSVVVLATVFLLGPLLSELHWIDYFAESETWRYLSTALLLPRLGLPGVFLDNPFPKAVNGSLWTLPVEFFCYITMAALASFKITAKSLSIPLALVFVVLVASFAPLIVGQRFSPHFEMIAMFWFGVLYGFFNGRSLSELNYKRMTFVLVATALLVFSVLGSRGLERLSMLVFSVCLVHLALRVEIGSKLTDHMGDLSYGMYIFAFPVQQILVYSSQGREMSFGVLFLLSFLVTFGLAFLSWHFVEKPALRFKP